jgi:hypothetical protein
MNPYVSLPTKIKESQATPQEMEQNSVWRYLLGQKRVEGEDVSGSTTHHTGRPIGNPV